MVNLSGGVHDAFRHALVTMVRTPGRAVAFGAAALIAAALLAFGLTDGASRKSDVNGAFDALAAQRVQVTTPVRSAPYEVLSEAHVSAIRALPGVEGVAWGNSMGVFVRDASEGVVVPTRLWLLNGDAAALGISYSRSVAPGRALVAGGGSAAVDAQTQRFDHVTVDGRGEIIGGVAVASPAVPDVLDSLARFGQGEMLDLKAPGELVVEVEPGWATLVAPRLAEIIAPGRGDSVLVRYPPEASRLRDGVLGSVDAMVYVSSGAILALGAGAVMIGTFFRVLAERRLLGLYRAIGASASFVVLAILFEAALVGSIGSLTGTILGLGIAASRALLTGNHLEVPWLLVAGGAVFGVIANGLAALLPALRTARETPLSAIRSR